ADADVNVIGHHANSVRVWERRNSRWRRFRITANYQQRDEQQAGRQKPSRHLYVCGSALSALITSAAWNQILLCVPSQKGLFYEAPQRHKAMRGRSSVASLFPAVS